MFTNIKSGFSKLDETINFGNRIVGEVKELREICTLAVITPENTDEKVTDVPIRSACRGGIVFFGVGKTFSIYKDKELSEQIACYIFESDVTSFAVSSCGNFVLICTCDGNIAIRQFHVYGDDVFQHKIDFKEGTILECFAHIEVFYVVLTTGALLEISLKNGNNKFEITNLFNFKDKITLCSPGDNIMYLQGFKLAYLLCLETHDIITMNSTWFQKVYPIESKFLAIDELGDLSLISSEGLVFKLGDVTEHYEQLVSLNDVANDEKVNLFAATKSSEEQGCQIQLITYPDFEKEYSLEVPSSIELMQTEESNGEVLFFSRIFQDDHLVEIRLQCVYEVDPVLKIERLNKKKKFDEALKLADLHGVDREIVLRAKAQDLIVKINCSPEDIKELLSILDQISETLYKMNLCYLTDCQTGEDARRILLYCINMDIDLRDTEENRQQYSELGIKEEINQKLFKLDTYMAVCQTYDCEEWKKFFNNDLLDEMIMFLQQGSIEQAIIICNRLDINALKRFDLHKVEEIMNVLDSMSPQYPIFLTAFIPVTLKHLPGAFPIFLSWLYQRIYALEHLLDFPKTAIKFVENFANILNNSVFKKNLCFEQNNQSIIKLYEALKDISELQQDFNVRVPVRDFVENPEEAIALLLRAGLSEDNFENMLNQFLCPYISRITTNRDEIFLSEINCLFACDESKWINIVPVLFKFIISDSNKLKAIDAILGAASLPWCEAVRNMAEIAFTLPPSAGDISKTQNHIRNEKRLVVMNKYQIGYSNIKTLDDIEFYVRRILYINGDNAVQDIYTLCRDQEDIDKAEFVMITKFIERQNIPEALTILDAKSPDQIVHVSEKLLNLTLGLVSNKRPLKYNQMYYESSSLCWNRIAQHCKDLCRKQRCQRIFDDIKSVYGLKQNFGVVCTWKDIRKPTAKENVLNEQIKKLKQIVESANNVREFYRLCACLASYLHLSPDEVMVRFMSTYENFQLLLQIGKYLCENSTDSKRLSLAAVIMFKFLKCSLGDDAEETFLDVTMSNTSNEDYLQSVKLARKLIVKAMVFATPDDHCAVMEVMRWVNSCYYLTNFDKKLFTSEINTHIYIPKNTSYPFCNALEGIKKTFSAYCMYIEGSRNPHTKYLTHFHQDISIDAPDFNGFLLLVNGLFKEGQHLTAYNVIKTLQHSFCYNNFKDSNIEYLENLIREKWFPQALKMVLSAPNIDKLLLLNIFLMNGPQFDKPLTKEFSNYRRQPNKIASLAEVGVKLTEIFKVSGKEKLLGYIYICKWWAKLNKNKITLQISYESFFKSDHESRLENLILERQLDMSNIAEYCTDFNIGNTESAYLKLLKITLLTWTPEFQVITDIQNNKTIELKNNEKELFNKCWGIIQTIENKKAVFELTEKIWPIINFYYYEVFLALLEIQRALFPDRITHNGSLYWIIIMFLKKCTRVATPSFHEKEQWFVRFPNSPFIDPLSEYRLPLHDTVLTNSIWKIIKAEINLTTYERWFKLSRFFKVLDQHDICVYAIKSVTESGHFQSNPDNQNNWDYNCHEQLITEVDNCAKNMADLEKATAAVYSLMCEMPPGADKVKMAELSYKYAMMHKDKSPSDEAEKIALKVKNRYYNFSVMHILHKYNLADKNYLSHVSSPYDLIHNLYKDPRILKNNMNSVCPDINGAVNEITKFFEMDKNKTKYISLIENFGITSHTIDNLSRACYICSDDGEFWRNILYQIGLGNECPYPDLVTVEHQDFAFKANALKCLYYISDREVLSEMINAPLEDFLFMIDKMELISEIISIGIPMKSVDYLDEIPKKKLLKDIARINYEQANCVRCMAKICKIYDIDDMKYWEYILKTATKLGMVDDLLEYVEELKFRNLTEAFKQAWRLIIQNAFSQETDNDSESATNAFVKGMRLLQTCPIVYALDIEYCAGMCISRKRFEFAAVLLQYLPKEKIQFYIEQLSSPTLVEDVRNLGSVGIVGIEQVLDIISEII